MGLVSVVSYCEPCSHSFATLSDGPDHSGWDVHDAVYSRELLVSNRANGYRDIIASIDLSTYRRIPWEDNVPFFLLSFLDPDTKKPLVVDPRGLLKIINERASSYGLACFAGIEYEVPLFYRAAQH
jgi:glutamine synthetase